jgi:uncharacterized protein (TIGR02444 family)
MPSDLWDFALRLYGRAGVEQACLQLQTAGADVCLLLCACWLQQTHTAYSPERCQQLQALAEPWQRDVITPLRQLRQSWRAAAQQQPELAILREQLKVLEQQGERQLLLQLQACVEAWPVLHADAASDWLAPMAAGATSLDALQVLRVEAHLT